MIVCTMLDTSLARIALHPQDAGQSMQTPQDILQPHVWRHIYRQAYCRSIARLIRERATEFSSPRAEELSVPEFCALACAGVSLLILADSSAAARRRRAVFANRLKIRRNKQQDY